VAKGEVFVGRRDKGPKDKVGVKQEQFVQDLPKLLAEIHDALFERAKTFRDQNIRKIESLAEFETFFKDEDKGGGFALVPWNEAAIGHEVLPRLKVTPRCIPLDAPKASGHCIFSGKPATYMVYFAKSY
jgi:prolyl-tRNA synthetase